MVGEVEELVRRAATLARRDDGEGLDELPAERTHRLQAAFASAKRREREPAMAGAADVLELALALRDGGALGGARWWHRIEVVLGLLALFNGFALLVQTGRPGWLGVASLVAVLIASIFVLVWWRRQVVTGKLPRPDPGLPPSAGRIPQLGQRALQAARDAVGDGEPGVDHLTVRMRDAVSVHGGRHGRLLAAAALGHAEQVLAASFEPRRRTLLQAARNARTSVLDEERPTR